MKTIIAGSRSCEDYSKLNAAIMECPWQITEIVSGGARGVDTMGEQYAAEFDIPLTVFPANWLEHGRIAGFIRNKKMADNAEALLALWDGTSKGTGHMIDIAKANGLRVYVKLL